MEVGPISKAADFQDLLHEGDQRWAAVVLRQFAPIHQLSARRLEPAAARPAQSKPAAR